MSCNNFWMDALKKNPKHYGLGLRLDVASNARLIRPNGQGVGGWGGRPVLA